jgi:hypothetical protein
MYAEPKLLTQFFREEKLHLAGVGKVTAIGEMLKHAIPDGGQDRLKADFPLQCLLSSVQSGFS